MPRRSSGSRSGSTVGRVIRWMHAFIDVATDAVDTTCSFWTAVTGWPVGAPWSGHPEFRSFVPPAGSDYLHVQRIEGPSRVHLDLMSHDIEADVDTHVALGATAVERYAQWQVMASPGGLPYCLVEERRERRRPPATRWPNGHRSRVAQLCVDVPAELFDGTDDVSAEVDRVRALGADLLDVTPPWAVFTDPVGLPFCVTPRPPE